ncbi:hypothetical protein [Bacillus cereus]|uniref:hypothetical protein n=1 Tax=Bacillus cereus group TaxID=86661 RepID=UPI001BAA4FCF|nr:hypothetical protein [Bacillus cereus]
MIKTIIETVEFDFFNPQDVDKYYRELNAHLDWEKDFSWRNNNVVMITFKKGDSQND